MESTLTEISRVTKKALIGALKGTGEKAQAIVETTADLVKATIGGVGDFSVGIEKKGLDISYSYFVSILNTVITP